MGHSAFTVVKPLLWTDAHALCRAVQKGSHARQVFLEVGSSAAAYELTRTLSSPAVLKPTGRTTFDGAVTLILEDFDGVSLESLLDRPMQLDQFLRIGVAMAEALADIHREGVIHKDIRPENILVDTASHTVKLVGFRIATRAPREPALGPPRLIEGSLPYMSPEQTGRMNRAMDQRSDLYSLGATLYRMLTARLPFEASDPVEWVYCHVAREPIAPCELITGLPVVVSDIVMKLLAKVVDDRYQTARGVAADLTRCLEQYVSTSTVESFRLGERDVSDRVRVPGKFYGREAELARLLAAFHRVVASGTPELVLVTGRPGIGKSSLVGELLRPIAREHGSFVAGKADQYNRGTPYSTIATGLRDLVLESLTGSERRVEQLRADLGAALGPNGQVVVDLVPEVELLIGKQPPVVPLPHVEAKNRFLASCQKLVAVLARSDHPVTLFLDDLQWADSASIELLQYILTHPDTHYLLALGAYRDNEVGASHPLGALRVEVARRSMRVTNLQLSPLSTDHVTELVADALHGPDEAVSPLASLVHSKTAGNPFFVIEFMGTLVRDGLLEFDEATMSWRWDVPRIEARDYTDNVVALMVRKIDRLPDETRAILRLAACIGTTADVDTLTVLSRRPAHAIHRALEHAVQEGLVLRQDGTYRFLHDRIQQSAYTLVAEGERAAFQLEIGRMLLALPKERDSHFFDIATHFRLGADAITDAAERTQCARLFLEAGKRAKRSLAYKDAVSFLSAGASLLAADSWQDEYELTYGLGFELAECQWLSGDFDAAEAHIPPLLSHARTTAERLRVYGIWVRVLMIRGEREWSLRVGLEALGLIGEHWALHPSAEEVKEAHDRLTELLGDRPIESLLELPTMTNEDMKAALDVVVVLFDTAHHLDWNLYALLGYFTVASSLRHGKYPACFVGYAIYALICGDEGRYSDCHRFGQIAYASLNAPENKAQASKICLIVGETLMWVKPYRSALEIFERAAREGAEISDPVWVVYSLGERVRVLLLSGEPLGDVSREIEKSIDAYCQLKIEDLVHIERINARVIAKLRGPTSPEEETTFDASDEPRWLNYVRCISLLNQLMGLCVLGAFEVAQEVVAIIEPILPTVRGTPGSTMFPFYHALTLAALYDEASESLRSEYLERLVSHERAFRGWAASCSDNFAAQHALIRAEIARIEHRESEAASLYEEAVVLARASGLVHIEGLANESGARFYRARGLDRIAKLYLLAASAAYGQWGAEGKVRQLARLHPEIREQVRPAHTIASRAEQLDLLSVVKAAQTISGELEIDRLIVRLIEVVLEQSGADIGRLLLVRNGKLHVECEARTTRHGIQTTLAPTTPGIVPQAVVNYVWRSHEKLLLEDAREPSGRGRFISDEYLASNRPKSVLCLPVIRGTAPLGLLYLENNLVTHAFTPERLTALDVIASQAAIALEIAFWIKREHEARDALARSEARFRRLYDSNMIGIVFSELSGAITDANDGFLEIAGYSREELAAGGLSWTDLTAPEYAERDQAAARETAAMGFCRPYEKEYIRKDGSRVPILLGGALLEGSKTETVAYILDMTERKRAERERARLLAQEQHARVVAEQALKVRDDFLSIAAHELRTPLTPLKLQIKMLDSLARDVIPKDSTVRDRLLSLLDKSGQQLDRLSALMAELLDASRIGGGLVLATEPTDLAEVARTLVTSYRMELAGAGCEVELVGEQQLVGSWDRGRLEQVVTNLLTNAMKYGAGKPITIGLARDGQDALLWIRDRGVGVEEKDQARIFERFERAVSLRHFGGFGLGLYIAREIVRGYGGNITVDSRLGAGSTFTIRLPLEPRLRGAECAEL